MSANEQGQAVPDEGAATPRCSCPEGPTRWGHGLYGTNIEPTCAMCGGLGVDLSKPRVPETDGEVAAVRGFVEHMLYHPDGLYDRLTVVELRDRVDTYLAGWRQVPR